MEVGLDLKRNVNEKMTDELKKYLIEQCQYWMLTEEVKALRRLTFTEDGLEFSKKNAIVDFKMEVLYGFKDDKINELVSLGKEALENKIAYRLLEEHSKELLNNCPKCGGLARTPFAKQCRHCGYDWHE